MSGPGESLQHLIVGDGLLAASARGEALAISRVSPVAGREGAPLGEDAIDECHVAAVDGVGGKLDLQADQRRFVLGADQHARGARVETMHDPGAALPADGELTVVLAWDLGPRLRPRRRPRPAPGAAAAAAGGRSGGAGRLPACLSHAQGLDAPPSRLACRSR
jgi:hypothetical protein